MRIIGSAIFLMVLWLLMSGIYKPMIVGLGAASVGLVLYVVARMDRVDGDQVRVGVRPLAAFGYFLWLLKEIAKANWTVTKAVLSPRMPIRQNLFDVPYTQKSDLGQVIFANSITLTPGTLTVETEAGHFQVHALCYGDGDMDALADMDRRVSATESRGAA